MIFRKNILLFLFLLFPAFVFAQKDSLLNILVKAPHDSVRLRLCNSFSEKTTNSNVELSVFFAEKALGYSRKLKDKKGEAASLNNLGYSIFYSGNADSAISIYQLAIAAARMAGDSLNVVMAYNRMGFVWRDKGDYPKSLESYNHSLKSNKNEQYTGEAASSYLNIGVLYNDQGNFTEALKYEKIGLKLFQDAGDEVRIANAFARIGNTYLDLKDSSAALQYYQESLALFEKNNHQRGIGVCLNNIAMIYDKQNQPDKAIETYYRAMAIREKIGDRNGVSIILNNLSIIYLELNNKEKALETASRGLEIADELKYREGQRINSLQLSKTYQASGDYEKALAYYKMYHDVYDSLNNEKSRKQVNELNALFDKERNEQKIKALTESDALKAESLEQVNRRNIFLAIAVVLLIAVVILIWRNANRSKKANVLLEQQKAEIAAQKKIVEEQHRDMLDSINYAQRIQHAVLPTDEERIRLFPESFVFYKPRDIVSGDFWWMSNTANLKMFAVGDCTGHGVPGAFMSLIGNTLLNEIVNEKKITDPGEILNFLSIAIVQALRQENGSDTEMNDGIVRDGMDISFCVIDESAGLLFFAGANNSMLVQSGEKLIELKGDRQPIGFFQSEKKPFSVQTLSLKEVQAVYMFSDGYADQFGGPKAKKFKLSRMKELIFSLQHLPMNLQEEKIREAFYNWKGNIEQIDDVLLIGFKI